MVRSVFNKPDESFVTFDELAVAKKEPKTVRAEDVATGPRTLQKITFHPNSQQYCVLAAIDTPFFIHRDDNINEDENGFKIQEEEELENERKLLDMVPDEFEVDPGNQIAGPRRGGFLRRV